MASAIKGTESTCPGRRPRQNFETWAWFFMRVSGLVLFFLALIHFFIMHIEHDVTSTTVAFVAQRWKNPFWRLFDWLLLVLGLFHGGNGLRTIIDDYVRRPASRVATKTLLYTVSFGLLLLGTVTIVTFR
ncbi:MAG: succinate dehydrogenase, hydrophobic membrane anchor protein [Ferrimicrobium sp.]